MYKKKKISEVGKHKWLAYRKAPAPSQNSHTAPQTDGLLDHTSTGTLVPLSFSLSINLALSEPSISSENLIQPLSQIYGIYFSFCSNAPIPSFGFDCGLGNLCLSL